MMLEREARLEEAQEESSLALGRRIQEIDQQQREIQVSWIILYSFQKLYHFYVRVSCISTTILTANLKM